MTFCQRKYTEDVLRAHGMSDANPARLPMSIGCMMKDHISGSDGDHSKASMVTRACSEDEADDEAERARTDPQDDGRNTMYRSVVGLLQYLVGGSRPDLCTSVRVLSQHLNDHDIQHWRMALQVLRYLVGTKNQGLRFDIRQAREYRSLKLELFVDADFANDVVDRKSITGYVLFLCGQLVAAKSWKQGLIAESTFEAETIAANEGLKELVWAEQLVDEMKLERSCSVIYCDNQAAISFMRHPTNHKRTKHAAIKYLKIRETLTCRSIELDRVASEDNVADANTKPLAAMLFEKFKSLMGVCDVRRTSTMTSRSARR